MIKFFNIAITMALVILLCSCSSESNKRLTYYHCKSSYDASHCTKNCQATDYSYSFIVNKSERSVMVKVYGDEKHARSFVLNNCKIFNEQNWECSAEPHWTGKWFVIHEKKMTDGVFTSMLYTSETGLSPQNLENDFGYDCAK